MKSFKTHYLTEGNTSKAFDMEHVIVSSAGGPKFKSKSISPEVGDKIVSSLKLTGKGSFPANSYPASKRWNEHFPKGAKGSTLTPKTDFIIGKKRISLKTGNAQLMSGGPSEAEATFSVAAETSGTELDKAVMEMQKHIENLLPSTDMTKLGIKGNKTELQKKDIFKDIDILKKADDAHHAFKNDLRKLFTSNQSFAAAFVFEAMTGQVKFGNNTGTADNFLVTDYNGNATIHTVTSMGDPYVKKISKHVKPDVKFKSSQKTSAAHKSIENPKGKTGFYTFWSAVGIGINMVVESALEDTDDMLTEGWIKNVVNKIKSWFKGFWASIKKQIGNSWVNLMEFAGINPQISFNNTPKW
jgi:hypothetical protein